MSTMSLHGLQLQLDPRLEWSARLQATLADVATVSARTVSPLSGSFAIETAAHAGARAAQPLAPGLARAGETLIDERYRVRLRLHEPGRIVLQTDRACPEWFSWCLQLAVLRNRATFVHAAGLARAGRALLLAAGSGFGKTALAAAFVRSYGWRLLGDDLILLTDDGTCYGYPRALVVHPEHRSFLPDLFDGGAGPSAPALLGKLITRTAAAAKPVLRHAPGLFEYARRHHPAATRVLPSQAFGNDSLGDSARLDTIVWLQRRGDLQQPELRAANELFVTRVFGGTVAEFDPWCLRASTIAMANGLLDAEPVYHTWLDVLRSALDGSRMFTLSLPGTLPFERMPHVVHDVLAEAGLLEPLEAALCR